MPQRSPTDLPFRLGAALLAAASGAAIALLLGLLFIFAGWSPSLARLVAGGALAGALSGAILPTGAIDFVEGTVHLFIGFFVTATALGADEAPSGLFEDEPERPQWLRWSLVFGVLLGLAAWGTSRF